MKHTIAETETDAERQRDAGRERREEGFLGMTRIKPGAQRAILFFPTLGWIWKDPMASAFGDG